MRYIQQSFGLVIALFFGFIPIAPVYAQTSSSVKDAIITFSGDESQVTISYSKGTWTFLRPMVVKETWMQQVTNPFGGKIYWVATNGSNTNPGTQAAPFATIQKGIDVAIAGDIVYINSGTYYEALSLDRSGQAGKPIVVSCAPGALGQVKVKFTDQMATGNQRTQPVIEVSGIANEIWINGLLVEGYKGYPGITDIPQFGEYAPAGVHTGSYSDTKNGNGPYLTNNVIYNNIYSGIKGFRQGTIKGNISFENGTNGTDHGIYMYEEGGKIIGNILFKNAGWGIHLYTAPDNVLVERNISAGNWGGIVVGGNNTKIYNNVATDNTNIGFMYWNGDSTGNVTKNNIFAFNLINVTGEFTTAANTDDYNTYFNTQTYKPTGIDPNIIVGGTHELYQDPQFVNRLTGDFRLKSNSPAIDKGVNVGSAFTGSAPDMGVFETGTTVTTSPTAIPVSPTVTSNTPSPTPVPLILPQTPPWWNTIPVNLRNFLEQLYVLVYYFQRTSNLQYLLEGVFPSPTP